MFLRSVCSSCRLCGSFPHLYKVSTRQLSEKFRDPRDFNRYSGRPDDLSKRKAGERKWTRKPEGFNEQRSANSKKDSKQNKKKASDPLHKWTDSQQKVGGSRFSHLKSKNSNVSRAAEDPGKSSEGTAKSEDNKASLGTTSSARRAIVASVLHITPAKPDIPPPPDASGLLKEIQASQKNLSPYLECERLKEEMDSETHSTVTRGTLRLDESDGGRVKLDVMDETVFKNSATSSSKNQVDTVLGKLDVRDVATSTETGLDEVAVGIFDKTKDSTQSSAVDSPKKLQAQLELGHSKAVENCPEREKDFVSKPSPTKPRANIEWAAPELKIVKESFNEKRRHRVYSFGFAETGALGFFKPNEGRRWRTYIPRPVRHQFAEENRVISAESGYGFTLFYVKSENNIKLYGCGLNTDFQLGPTVAEVVTYPSPIDIHMKSYDTKIVSFSAGRAHTVVATDNEGVFLLGSNRYGQCGRAIEEENEFPQSCTITQIKRFGGEKVVAVQCGQDHTCFITATGKVFSCGWGADGQTGLGHTAHVWEPRLVQGAIEGETIVKVAGKCDTVLALNDKGELFGWGNNEFKQIKDDIDAPQVDSPFKMEHVNKICGKLVDVAAGNSFCVVLNQEGNVYVWGYGILGGGPLLEKTIVPKEIPWTLFGNNDYQPKAKPSRVYCGVDHMLVVNNLSHVYAWGKNKQGCLGIGNGRDQYFPYKLAVSANAIHVTCSVDHSVIVTDHNN